MDKATLVKSDLKTLGRVIEALSSAGILMTACDLSYVPEIDELEIVVATPLYDSKGPLEASSRIIAALTSAGIYKDVPIRRVSVLSPSDSRAKTLKQEIEARTEGAIHIVSHDYTEANRQRVYSVIFAPFSGPGGAVPAKHFRGLDELRAFLVKRLHIGEMSVDDALSELARKGSTSIFNVEMTNKDAKRLGLA